MNCQPAIAATPPPSDAVQVFDLQNIRVSMFEDAYKGQPVEVRLGPLLEAIRKGRWQQQIARIRPLYTSDPERYKVAKTSLPGFTMSGTGRNRREALTHTGLLQVDIDHLRDKLEDVRRQVQQDPHVAFGYVSPSGAALKLGVRIDGRHHLAGFFAAQEYFKNRYGQTIDPQLKDRLRLSFVSHDPEMWVNPAALELPLKPEHLAAAEAYEKGVSRPSPPAEDDRGAAQPATPKPEAATPPQSSEPADEPVRIIILPSGSVSFSDAALQIFSRIAPATPCSGAVAPWSNWWNRMASPAWKSSARGLPQSGGEVRHSDGLAKRARREPGAEAGSDASGRCHRPHGNNRSQGVPAAHRQCGALPSPHRTEPRENRSPLPRLPPRIGRPARGAGRTPARNRPRQSGDHFAVGH